MKDMYVQSLVDNRSDCTKMYGATIRHTICVHLLECYLNYKVHGAAIKILCGLHVNFSSKWMMPGNLPKSNAL